MRSPDSLKSIMIILVLLFFGGCESQSQSIERPEKIVSKRVVVYDDETEEYTQDSEHVVEILRVTDDEVTLKGVPYITMEDLEL